MSAHCGVMHRDIKLDNILVRKRQLTVANYSSEVCAGDFEFKIADLGLAKTHKGEELLRHTHCGSPLYMAPEILLGKEYNSQADVWSLGVLLYHLLVGTAPFQSKSIAELYKKVQTGVYHLPTAIKLSFDCIKFLDQCLQADV
jgi:serine/threonine protein kinase